jgi:acetyl-CoA acetyltransferase family protein
MSLSLHTLEGLVQRCPEAAVSCDALRWGIVVLAPRIPHFARDVVLRGPLPNTVRAVTVTDNCITGATAVVDLARAIQLGRARIGIAGGVESMSNPALLLRPRANRAFLDLARARGVRQRLAAVLRLRPRDFLPVPPSVSEPSTGLSMGEHCELMVEDWGVTREDQDRLAYGSHQRAARARREGLLAAQIHPLPESAEDSLIRDDTTLEALARLRPVFDTGPSGSITAGSSSPLTDGAAAVLLAGEEALSQEGLEPKAWIRDYEFASVSPTQGLLMAPGVAVPRLLARNGLRLGDIDVFEVHEAFAGQVLCNLAAWARGWLEPAVGEVDVQRLNCHGGSIALGHPFSATGLRLVTSATNALARDGGRYALVSVCGAGATAAALLLERA